MVVKYLRKHKGKPLVADDKEGKMIVKESKKDSKKKKEKKEEDK